MRPLLTNEALEEIVAEEPYDDDGWSVLEDWLLEQDDPRAEILRSADPAAAREPLLPLLLGPELPSKGLEWRGGYVTEAMFYPEDTQRLVEQFVKAPAVSLLRTLSIATGLPELRGAYAALAAASFGRSLRLLQLSSDESGVLPSGVLDGLHRLDTLMLERVVLDTTDASVFHRLVTLSVAPAVPHDLVAFLCPRPLGLRTLRLDFRHLRADVPIHELAPLWDGALTPRLQHLIVRDREPVIAKVLLGILAVSELTPRLRELTLGDVACEPAALLGFGTTFHHLEKLSLPDDVRRFHNQPF